MKTKQYLRITCLLLVLAVIFTACEEDDDTNNYKQAEINHYGFDFSAGAADMDNWENNDGETISWQPGAAQHPDYPSNDVYIWWRNSAVSQDGINLTRDMGPVELSSVKEAPAEWDAAPDILPLLEDHVVVAKCRDGYVKFKVLSADTANFWTANVEYYFSETAQFDE